MVLPPMLIGLAFALMMIVLLAILLRLQRLTRRTAISMQFAVMLVAGLLLGGVPDPVAQLDSAVRSVAHEQLPLLPLIGLGLLLVTALIAGRAFCGHACPLGAAQELLSVPVKRKVKIKRAWADRVRWGFLVLFVALAVLTTSYPKYDPFAFFNLNWALLPAIAFSAIMAASLFIYRPWCNLLCPFGALASLASRRSVLRLRRNEDCIDCGRCVRTCPTGEPKAGATMEGCYYCGRCIDVCPKQALIFERKP
ncbi:MAG: 4Fe-4S binding protein [Methanomassiliicoccus sp.]|nr:4Fe-4S binding protein [Methanomassiliicoccus sp.]